MGYRLYARANHRLSSRAADKLPPAMADPNPLEMVLLNLAVNAWNAMPDGVVLKIEAMQENVCSPHRTKLRPGQYLILCAPDTGVGMDEVTLARAVEPLLLKNCSAKTTMMCKGPCWTNSPR